MSSAIIIFYSFSSVYSGIMRIFASKNQTFQTYANKCYISSFFCQCQILGRTEGFERQREVGAHHTFE